MSFIGNIFGAYAAKQLGKFNENLFKLQSDIAKRNAEIKKKTFETAEKPRLLKSYERNKSNLLVSLLKSGIDVDRIGETPYLMLLEQEVENDFDLAMATYNSTVTYQNEVNQSLPLQARGAGEKYKGELMFRTEMAKAAGKAASGEYGSLLS